MPDGGEHAHVAAEQQLFTETQWSTLRTLVDLIIPPDESPGGWEAGAGRYIERQLAGELHGALNLYRAGLDGLTREAQAMGAPSLAELDPARQVELLQAIEQGAVHAPWQVNPAAFFRTAVDHTMEGFYSDPGNGGNRNMVAWQMLGFEVHG